MIALTKVFRNLLLSILVTVLWNTSAFAAESTRTDIHAEPEMAQPLMPGMKPPSFTVLDGNGAEIRFNPDKLDTPLIITFYRGGWCPYCNLHLSEMRHAEEAIEQMGYDIWFISVDKPELLKASLDEPDLNYQVLSDFDLEATRGFGIAFKMPDELVERYLGFGLDIEEVSGKDHHVLPVPSTFIIGRDGVIKFAYSNPDYAVRLAPDVLVTAAEVYVEDGVDQRLRREYEDRKKKAEQ